MTLHAMTTAGLLMMTGPWPGEGEAHGLSHNARSARPESAGRSPCSSPRSNHTGGGTGSCKTSGACSWRPHFARAPTPSSAPSPTGSPPDSPTPNTPVEQLEAHGEPVDRGLSALCPTPSGTAGGMWTPIHEQAGARADAASSPTSRSSPPRPLHEVSGLIRCPSAPCAGARRLRSTSPSYPGAIPGSPRAGLETGPACAAHQDKRSGRHGRDEDGRSACGLVRVG